MAKPFRIKRNDLSRSIKWYPRASPATNYTGATAVFNMRFKDGSTKINRATATIGNDADGTFLQYDWAGTDTDTAGDFEAEFEATLSSGKPETTPNDGFIWVKIDEDIA